MCPSSLNSIAPVLAFHSRAVVSHDAVQTRRPSGLAAMALTQFVWPVKDCSTAPSLGSQSCTVQGQKEGGMGQSRGPRQWQMRHAAWGARFQKAPYIKASQPGGKKNLIIEPRTLALLSCDAVSTWPWLGHRHARTLSVWFWEELDRPTAAVETSQMRAVRSFDELRQGIESVI